MIYLELFLCFFQIGLFSIGGGYASMPLIQNQVVEINHWLTLSEFSDVITISQMTPGPIAINSATFVGIQIAGIPGALVATLGCILPSCSIVLLLAFLYYKYQNLSLIQGTLNGLRPAVVAMITGAGVSLFVLSAWNGATPSFDYKQIDFIAVIIFVIALFILRKWKPNPTMIMAGSGVLGVCIYPFLP